MAEHEIDAGAVLDERDRERGRPTPGEPGANVEGARGRAHFAGARRAWPVGARTFLVVTGLVAGSIVVVLLFGARNGEAGGRGAPARGPGAHRARRATRPTPEAGGAARGADPVRGSEPLRGADRPRRSADPRAQRDRSAADARCDQHRGRPAPASSLAWVRPGRWRRRRVCGPLRTRRRRRRPGAVAPKARNPAAWRRGSERWSSGRHERGSCRIGTASSPRAR